MSKFHSQVLGAFSVLAVVVGPVAAQDETSSSTSSSPAAEQAEGSVSLETGLPAGESAFERRFRWGMTGGFGPMVGAYSGFGGGLSARFGMQMSPLLGVYAQPVVLFGVGAQADIDGAEAVAAALYGVGALADVTLADLIYLAAGPELLLGGFGSASANADAMAGSAGANVEAGTGPFFGIATRAGFVFGTKTPTKRSGFSLGVDMHVALTSADPIILPLVFLGYDSF